MNIPLYILSLIICSGIVVGLYFLLRNKSQKTQKIVLFSILIMNIAGCKKQSAVERRCFPGYDTTRRTKDSPSKTRLCGCRPRHGRQNA